MSTVDASLPTTNGADNADDSGSDTSEPPRVFPPPPVPEPSWSATAPSLPAFYLDTIYEPPAPAAPKLPAQARTSNEGMDVDGNGGGGNEGYEQVMPKGVDAAFLAFTDRISRPGCAAQVVRTSSAPLPYTDGPVDPEGDAKRCGACGEPRRFEAQVMPHAIGVLEKGCDVAKGEDLGWATALIWTCANAACAWGKEGDDRGVWLEEGVRLQYE
jgi:hypothetical protein